MMQPYRFIVRADGSGPRTVIRDDQIEHFKTDREAQAWFGQRLADCQPGEFCVLSYRETGRVLLSVVIEQNFTLPKAAEERLTPEEAEALAAYDEAQNAEQPRRRT